MDVNQKDRSTLYVQKFYGHIFKCTVGWYCRFERIKIVIKHFKNKISKIRNIDIRKTKRNKKIAGMGLERERLSTMQFEKTVGSQSCRNDRLW